MCKIPKLEEIEFTNRSSKSNLKRSICKVCEAAYLRAKRAPKLLTRKVSKEKAKLEALANPLKNCTGCLEIKPKSEFNKAKKGFDGLTAWCKNCYQKWAEDNKEALILKRKEYRKKNRTIIKDKKREYSKTEKSIKQRKEYILKNPEVKRRISNKYAKNNSKKNRERRIKWVNENLTRHRKYCREYVAKRARTDIGYAMMRRLRSRILSALKGKNIRKAAKTVELLGCSVEEFKNHLQQRFHQGMTWENRGEWHIDHIVPCASFNLSDPMQQRICFHYTNLQPLWEKENRRKKDKIEKPIQMFIPLQFGG